MIDLLGFLLHSFGVPLSVWKSWTDVGCIHFPLFSGLILSLPLTHKRPQLPLLTPLPLLLLPLHSQISLPHIWTQIREFILIDQVLRQIKLRCWHILLHGRGQFLRVPGPLERGFEGRHLVLSLMVGSSCVEVCRSAWKKGVVGLLSFSLLLH